MNSSGLVSFERFWGLCKRQLDMDYVYYIYFNSTRIRAICKIWGGFVNPFWGKDCRTSHARTHAYCDPKVSLSIFRKNLFRKILLKIYGYHIQLESPGWFCLFLWLLCYVLFRFFSQCLLYSMEDLRIRTLAWLIEKRRKTFSNF